MADKNLISGGEFLVRDVDAKDIFIPEEFDEEQQMIAQTCEDFVNAEIVPNLQRLDDHEDGLLRNLLEKSGELGLLGISIPEKYDGFDQNFITAMIVADYLGGGHGWSVAQSADTGIGTLPLLYYGNDEQKQKYLPKLASGEWMAAYCLTEPNAGSDANSGSTRAILSEDGKHYIINGQKMWITNAGIADLLTVFAKIDNDRILSTFLVERDYPGITFNPEEKKMGIKGSSTRQIFFNDVKVPVENMIGKRGEGFRIALNILHVGRVKLGANVLGGGRMAINKSVEYSNERKQFGKLISSYGAIKSKLAEQIVKQFVTESALYRTSGDIENIIKENMENGMTKEKASIDGIGKYAIEAAILKVYGSEGLDFIVDEAVQIYGGMGFSSESQVDNCYRDSRINRIFEGTNEINRMVIIDTLLKFTKRGDYDIFGEADKLMSDFENIDAGKKQNDYYAEHKRVIKNIKNAILITLGSANKDLERKLNAEQEIMMSISDMIIELYIAESTMLRVQKIEANGTDKDINLYKNILNLAVYYSAQNVFKHGKDAVNSFAPEDKAEKLNEVLYKLTKTKPLNIKNAKRKLADKLIEENKYCF